MRVQRGKRVFKDVPTAAKALGVKPGTIYVAMSRGRVDHVGIGRGKGPKSQASGGRPSKPVAIGPCKWGSYSECARALGVDHRYIRNVMHRGGDRAKATLLAKVMHYHNRQERDNAGVRDWQEGLGTWLD